MSEKSNYWVDYFLDIKKNGQGLLPSSLKAYRTAFNHLLSSDLLDLDFPETLTPRNLELPHINLSEGFILVQNGKGGKDRIIPIVDTLKSILEKYEKTRLDCFQNSLAYFHTFYGGKLQHREIYTLLQQLKSVLPFKITTHMFRHTFATELAKHDLNLYNIASILGHSNINTTKIYLSFQVDPIKQKLNSIDLFH